MATDRPMEAERAFVDTNLFLRYLTDDVPEQAQAVEVLLRRAEAGKLRLYTSTLVVAEIVWTLESHYRLPRQEVRRLVLAVLNTSGLEVEDHALLLQAVGWYDETGVDFIDAYNVAWLRAQGLEIAFTFDRKHFTRLEGVIVREP